MRRFMLHMARVLRSIRAVPPHAAPVVAELTALMARAEAKAAKYDARSPLPALLLMYFEQVRRMHGQHAWYRDISAQDLPIAGGCSSVQ